MDYEKKYKDAQKWMEGVFMELSHERQMEAEAFFPEIKESNDERIRKELLDYIEKSTGCKEWVAWIKMQDPKKFEEELEKAYKCADEVQYRNGYEDAIREIEKQGEQKTTDKVEPKFKVGDWVVDDQGKVNQVTSATDDGYGCCLYDGTYICGCWKDYYHLWTIKDAKDGDILYSLDSKRPFIFKHRKPHEQATPYCGINIYGKFFVVNTKDCIITTDKYIPADKFQRNLLFQKMKESGYEWDAEKKELRKIEFCGDVCTDNRFEIIEKAKQHLLTNTNIETSEDEMKCLDSFLFRCWQMGWLKQFNKE